APLWLRCLARRFSWLDPVVTDIGVKQSGQTLRDFSSCRTRGAVNGSSTSATPSASATALAMHTDVLIEFPSATPLAPSGVIGEGVSRCNTTRPGTMPAVGTA